MSEGADQTQPLPCQQEDAAEAAQTDVFSLSLPELLHVRVYIVLYALRSFRRAVDDQRKARLQSSAFTLSPQCTPLN